jgi:hypothetical protein
MRQEGKLMIKDFEEVTDEETADDDDDDDQLMLMNKPFMK